MSYKNFCFENVKEEKDHAEDTSLKVVKYARTPVMSTYLVAFLTRELRACARASYRYDVGNSIRSIGRFL